MSNKPQLHQSMLDLLSQCGVAFQFRYGKLFDCGPDEIIKPPTLAMAVGTATHKAIEANYRAKIKTGVLMPTDEVEDVARDDLQRIKKDEGIYLAPEERLNKDKAVNVAEQTATKLAGLHAVTLAPDVDPIDVERRFVLEMPDYPIDLSGQIDLIEAGAVIDNKTSSSTPSVNAAKTLQMAMYALAYKVDPTLGNGQLPDRVAIHALVKLKNPKAVSIDDKPTDEWLSPLMYRIERFVSIIKAAQAGHNVFVPAPATDRDWMCTRRYCPYHDRCPHWTKR